MPQKYGKWVVNKSLGEGGQAHTFLVYREDDANKTDFVLKRLKNKKRIDRFQQEIRAGLSLSHPNVLRVEDSDLDSDPPFLVTEYCQGGSLDKISFDQYTVIDRLKMFSAICRGVGHAHSNGVIHRDLKPDNIFLQTDKTTPVVGDFGICFLTDEGERFTIVDEVMGNRFCTAPELEGGRAETVHSTSDVYCLGKLLYWMVGGRSLPRELHRDPKYDLTTGRKDAAIFLIYELLDKMIVEDSSQRFGDGNEIAKAVDLVVSKILRYAHPIDPTTPQECTYCGQGLYEEVEMGEFGLPKYTGSIWFVLVCDHCGNVQIFRPDKAKNPGVWKKK